MAYTSLKEIEDYCREKEVPFWKTVLMDNMNERGVAEEASLNTMKKMWEAMLFASTVYDKNQMSGSMLVGGMGGKMEEY